MEERKEILMNDLMLLANRFYKVVEANLNDGTYFEVKSDGTPGKTYRNLNHWATEFGKTEVHHNEKDRFMNFFNRLEQFPVVYYRRKINDTWRWVCMEVIPFDTYTPEDKVVLIIVRDVEHLLQIAESQVWGRA